MHRRVLLPLLLANVCAAALVPHAIFANSDALRMYHRFLPPIQIREGVICTNTVKRHLLVQSVLNEDQAFMVLGWDGVSMNAFFCTKQQDGKTHRMDACVVHEDMEGEALLAFSEWHSSTFGEEFALELA